MVKTRQKDFVKNIGVKKAQKSQKRYLPKINPILEGVKLIDGKFFFSEDHPPSELDVLLYCISRTGVHLKVDKRMPKRNVFRLAQLELKRVWKPFLIGCDFPIITDRAIENKLNRFVGRYTEYYQNRNLHRADYELKLKVEQFKNNAFSLFSQQSDCENAFRSKTIKGGKGTVWSNDRFEEAVERTSVISIRRGMAVPVPNFGIFLKPSVDATSWFEFRNSHHNSENEFDSEHRHLSTNNSFHNFPNSSENDDDDYQFPIENSSKVDIKNLRKDVSTQTKSQFPINFYVPDEIDLYRLVMEKMMKKKVPHDFV